MNKIGVIFDLDGVIVDTAKYHFLAWKNLADDLGFEFTEANNELLNSINSNDPSDIINFFILITGIT